MSIGKQNRIAAIDILKFIAVFAVINSHMDIAYGDYSILATGGAIGDALFFFASGFMLFRGREYRFDNFMKRRVGRIYPAVIIVAILNAMVYGSQQNIIDSVIFGGGWFVECIMIYYVFLWGARKWFIKKLSLVWITASAVIIGAYYFIFEPSNTTVGMWIYGYTYFKWVFFFTFMLLGAQMGQHPDRYGYNRWVLLKLIGCVIFFYAFCFMANKVQILEDLQYLTILPLLGITYYIYVLCCAPIFKRLYANRICGKVIYIIGGLCLDSYLVQFFIISDKYNYLFPLNIFLITLCILVAAYVVNFLSSALRDTFNKDNYRWRDYLLWRQE